MNAGGDVTSFVLYKCTVNDWTGKQVGHGGYGGVPDEFK